MIPEKYRKMLPPYWYENRVAEYHFEGAATPVEYYAEKRNDLRQQLFPLSATWGLDYWDWTYFGKKQSSSLEQRRKNIQQQHWAYLGFAPEVLRAIGIASSEGKRVEMIEDYPTKLIRYVYPIHDRFDIRHAVTAVEKIRPVHCNGVGVEPTTDTIIELIDQVLIGLKRYHMVKEFRVGMTPIKQMEEVVI
ncbi:hypothetical protein BRE01_23950 [Brevibacillus reuszeri]|uniref:DUF2313 domain-containing protein n=1 Tax=Brevibacillus reuszeri TaxID=54915 RepID=A0A0K9YP40_9BACL|nr:putative phage tail protein [Brevibacillus reuszeri]KNB69945.1 hypothetical protein ADS79_29390 [Brevibacillus reuszeri]MED1858309.1 DUF2313 domain-containing protein [Brevibacillus reuszeri]GED68693.1 hypothetical protein BRE01_23950 [Brevibacillus reuszeri]